MPEAANDASAAHSVPNFKFDCCVLVQVDCLREERGDDS